MLPFTFCHLALTSTEYHFGSKLKAASGFDHEHFEHIPRWQKREEFPDPHRYNDAVCTTAVSHPVWIDERNTGPRFWGALVGAPIDRLRGDLFWLFATPIINGVGSPPRLRLVKAERPSANDYRYSQPSAL